MRKLFLPAAILIISLFIMGCEALAVETNPENLVPAESTFIAKAKVAEALNDLDFESLYDAAPMDSDDPQTLDGALDEIWDRAGIDFRRFSSVVIFGDSLDVKGQGGVIASGKFDEATLLAALEEELEAPMVSENYQGYQLHTVTEDEGQIAFSVLGEDLLVAGSPSGVKAVIEVKEGDRQGASGAVWDAFSGLGDPLFRMAMQIPDNVSQELEGSFGAFPDAEGMGNLVGGMEWLDDLDMITVVADKSEDTVQLQANLDFTTEEKAAEFKNMVDGLLLLARNFAMSGDAGDLLDKLQIELSGNNLTISFEALVSELKELSDSWGEGTNLKLTPEFTQ